MEPDNPLESQLERLYRAYSAQKEAKVKAGLKKILRDFGLDTDVPRLPCCIEAARTGVHPRVHGDTPVALPADDAPANPSAKLSGVSMPSVRKSQ